MTHLIQNLSHNPKKAPPFTTKVSHNPGGILPSHSQLNLNEDVTDRRDKVTFHTLRHTYASMLVQKGVDIYQVKELLGHSSIALTERYSHLSESTLKHAALMIQGN